jgi:type IX secretion system substrate protein
MIRHTCKLFEEVVMKYLSAIILGLLVLAFAASAQTDPPTGLAADLMQGGAVDLTWNAPSDGLNEDFEDGLAQGFEILTTPGTYLIEAGYLKLNLVPNTTTWGSGTYNDLEFGDMTVTSTFEIQDASTSSRGILWRANGPRDGDFNGYGMYVSSTSYSVWRYAAGSATNLVAWTTSLDINTGAGAVNTLSVVAVGSNFDLYINGVYQGSTTDATYATGYAGFICAYGTLTWYEDIIAGVGGPAPDAVAQIGAPVVGNFDDMGNAVNYDIVTEGPGLFDRFGEAHYTNELDEFIEYRIWRDGNLIDTSVIESYTDQLPGPGAYSYEVTALYDEGESDPAGPVDVEWITAWLDLTGTTTVVPMGGGDVVYDAEFVSTVGAAMGGLRYQTFALLPNNQVVGPIDNIPFNLTPFMNVTITGLSITVPGNAPLGNYILEGRAGIPNNPNMQVTDSFPFSKVGAGLFEDFEDGLAQDFTWFVGDLGSYSIDGGYAKVDVFTETDDWGSGAYTGQTFGDCTVSSTMEFVQTIGNSTGLLFRGNGVQDASYTGYAIYLSNGYYSCWVYNTPGVPTNIIGWTIDPAINQGVGAINVLEVDCSGSTFDITCNGTYIGSFTDASIASGYAGFACAYQNETWFDDLSAMPGVVARVSGPVEIGALDPVLRDHMGNVITDPADFYTPGVAFDRSAEFTGTEFEFIPEDWAGNSFSISSDEGTLVGVPTEFALENAYPNPFNPSTTFAVTLPATSDLTVAVYNVTGQLVTTLANDVYASGRHTMTFDASNLASGLYFLRATVPGQLDQTQKIMLVR